MSTLPPAITLNTRRYGVSTTCYRQKAPEGMVWLTPQYEADNYDTLPVPGPFLSQWPLRLSAYTALTEHYETLAA